MMFNSNSRYSTFSFCEFSQGPSVRNPPLIEGSAVSMRNTPWEPLRKHWAKGLMDLLLGIRNTGKKHPDAAFVGRLSF